MLANSCTRFRSTMDVPIILPAWNLCKTSWNVTAFLIRVSITAPITFQRTSRSPIPLGICVALGDEDQDFPTQLCWDSSIIPHKMDQLHKFHPFIWVGGRCFLLCRVILHHPRLEVIVLQVHVSPFPIPTQTADCCIHFWLSWESVFNLEWVNMGGDWPPRRGRFPPPIKCSVFPRDFIQILLWKVGLYR